MAQVVASFSRIGQKRRLTFVSHFSDGLLTVKSTYSIAQRRHQSTANREDIEASEAYLDPEEHSFSPHPWQSLLEPAARAGWRSSSQGPPAYLAQEHFTILQECESSSKQLRRAHEQTVKSHMVLAERRERERRRAVNPRITADSLAHKKEVRRDSQAGAVYYVPEKTLANLKHRLLPNYAIAKRVLIEAKSLLTGDSSFQPLRVVDFGAGCGSASAAAIDVFDTLEWVHAIDPSRSMRDGAERVLQAVSNEKSVDAPRITVSESLSTERTNSSFDIALFSYTAVELPHVASTLSAAAIIWEKLRPNGILVMIEPGTPDGFNSVRAVRDMLLECCPPNKSEEVGIDQCHVLAPCTHNGKCPMERHQRRFSSKKEGTLDVELDKLEPKLVDASDEYDDEESSGDDNELELEELDFMEEQSVDERVERQGQGMETHAFDSAYCSFVHTFPGGSRRSSGEKFSYLVVQKRVQESEEKTHHTPDHDDDLGNLTDLLLQTCKAGESRRGGDRERLPASDKDSHLKLLEKARVLRGLLEASTIDKLDLEMLHGDSRRQSFGRIVRAPLKKRGHVLVDYCSSPENQGDGKIIRHRVGKGWGTKVAPGIYAAARKARWGGFWPDINRRRSEEESPETSHETEGAKDPS